MKLTGNKDVDRKILNNLEDEDLVKFCTVDKKSQSLCNDQVFWMNRVFLKFGYVGGDVLRANKKDRTWSEYYIKDLRKINKSNAKKYLLSGSERGRLDHVIISLMGHGADIHTRDDTALFWASKKGHLDIVRYLVEFKPDGANIHALDDLALIWASQYGQIDIVRYLISAGANIHASSDGALRYSSINGHLDIVKYLVGLGANIHAENDYALRWASKRDHLEVVKYLKSLP